MLMSKFSALMILLKSSLCLLVTNLQPQTVITSSEFSSCMISCSDRITVYILDNCLRALGFNRRLINSKKCFSVLGQLLFSACREEGRDEEILHLSLELKEVLY